jgi:hypothetical protein
MGAKKPQGRPVVELLGYYTTVKVGGAMGKMAEPLNIGTKSDALI